MWRGQEIQCTEAPHFTITSNRPRHFLEKSQIIFDFFFRICSIENVGSNHFDILFSRIFLKYFISEALASSLLLVLAHHLVEF